MRLCYDARKAGYKFGETVSIFARQGELFAEPDELQTAADFNNATVLMLADVINSREVTKLRKTLALYNDAAREPASGQMDMFADGGIRSREDVLRDVINYINKNGRTKAIKDAVAAGVARRREASVPKDGVAEAGIGGSENAERRGGGKTPVERKSDLAQAEPLTYHLSDEVDEKGRQFVLTSDGNVEFGKIGQDTGLTPAPILLSEGMITNPETNDGYGLIHIEARHGEQIRNAGYKSVLEFIEEVAKNYEVIREGKDRYGQQTYMLQLTDKHNNTLMVELSGDGTYWNINTAGIFKTSYGAKRNVVYNRHTTAKQSAETVEATLSGEQSGTTPSTSMNAPTQTSVDDSASKGKLVWKHADDVSAASDVKQGLYSSQGNMSDPTTEGTDAPQTNVLSASKGKGNTSTAQEQTEKVAKDHTPNANLPTF